MTPISNPNEDLLPKNQPSVQESDPDAVFEEKFIPILLTEAQERELDSAFDDLFGTQSVTDPSPEDSQSDF